MIICAIGLRRGAELIKHLSLLQKGPEPLLLVHVIDAGPRRGWEQTLRPVRPGPHPPWERNARMNGAEVRSGETILSEAQAAAGRLGWTAAVRLERGNPEQVLVAVARETGASLLVEFARELPEGHPVTGPSSIGHTARFVLDHAPCPVLLLR